MPKPVESSCEREARRVYEELGLGTAQERNTLLRELGAELTGEELVDSWYQIRTSPDSEFESEDDAELERASQ